MGLSNDLISQFVKITKDNPEPKKETTVYGTIKKVDENDSTYNHVQLDGSDRLTPVSKTVVANDGDRVTVMIKNHTATVTGNLSNPAPRKEDTAEKSDLNAESARIDNLTAANVSIQNKLTVHDADIEELKAKNAEFEDIVAGSVTTEMLEAEYAKIERLEVAEGRISDLEVDNADITGRLTATEAAIEDLQAKYIDVDTLNATYATIASLDAAEAEIDDLEAKKASIVALDAAIGRINTLESNSVTTVYLQSNYITASEIESTYITATKVAAEYAKITTLESDYAQVNLANVAVADIGTMLANAGLITTATIKDGHVTGYLDAVEVNANNITAGTLSVDRLVISGSDKSIVYELNNSGELTSTEVDTINGDVITKRTIAADHIIAGAITANELHSSSVTSDKIASGAVTAGKISVISLESIVAKIGSFNINNSLYSNNHTAFNTNVDGVYIGSDYISLGKGGKTWLKNDGSVSIGNGAITYDATSDTLNVEANTIKMGSDTVATMKTVTDTETALEQYADGVANTAKQTAISTAESDATSKANAAKQAAIDSVETTLQNYATLSVTDSKISSAVSASETTVKTYADGKANTAESNAKSYTDQTANSITSTVSSTYATKTELTDGVNGIQVGAKNLILNSDLGGNSIKYTRLDGYTTEGGFWFVFDYEHPNPTGYLSDSLYKENSYTISMRVRGRATINLYRIAPDGNSALHFIAKNELSETDYKLKTLTFTPHKDRLNAIYICSKYGEDSTLVGDWFEIAPNSLKLEKGTKATDWTPAPEDIETRVESAETNITQLADRITANVTETTSLGTRMSTMEQKADGFTWSIDETALVSTVNEYYQSTSATSLSGGSWSTTQPTWTQGTYIWFRTKNTNGKGTVSYSTAVCVTGNTGAKGDKGDTGNNGATGATGTGISSITREYYVSTSKTTQSGGSWSTTTPVWSSGKYIWIRDKIVYTNPSSTVYTTPFCDSSWEAVNGIEVGGRNLLLNSKERVRPPMTTGTASDKYNYERLYCDLELNQQYTISADVEITDGEYTKISVYPYPNGINTTVNINNGKIVHTFTKTSEDMDSILLYTGLAGATEGNGCIFRHIKIEKGNKATDWTPAPEDVESNINDAAKTATNFMNFTDSGLVIGDMTAGTLGRNVLIDSDSVDIRNGETTLASFGENYLYLAKNSRNATIDLCNGLATLKHSSKLSYDTMFTISTIDTVEIQARTTPLCLTSTVDFESVTIQFAYTDESDTPVVMGGLGFVSNVLKRFESDMYTYHTVLDSGNYYDVMDSGWKYVGTYGENFANYSDDLTSKPQCRKIGKMVEVRGVMKPTTAITGSNTKYTMFTLPSGYRPDRQINKRCQGSSSYTWLLTVDANGTVSFSRYGNGSSFVDTSTSSWLPFQITFFVN